MDISEIFKLLGLSTAFSALVYFLLRFYFTQKIKVYFDKNLEEYKQKLNIAIEKAKYEFEKRLKDFSLFINKKHEVYSEFNKKVLIAEDFITSLYGLRTELTFEEHNEDDLKRIMESSNFPKGKIEQILNLFVNGEKDKAIEEMRFFFRLKEFNDSNNALIEARNYFWSSYFYFSDTVETLVKEVISLLNELLVRQEMIFKNPNMPSNSLQKLSMESIEIKSKISPKIEELIKSMKSEISQTNYL